MVLQNQVFARSITEGFGIARGKYFCRWDGDDCWPSDALETLAQALDTHPESVVSFGHISLLSAQGRLVETPSTRPAGQPERNEFEFLLRSHYSCAPAMMARHSSWQPLMPWLDGRIDWFYNLHLARQGNFVYVDRVVAHYRTHEQGHHTMSLREGLAEQHFELILREFSPMATKTMRRVTGHTYLHIALSYFGLDRELDARRCFKIAMRNAPLELFNRRCIGPLLACFVIGSKRYNAIKLRLKVLWK